MSVSPRYLDEAGTRRICTQLTAEVGGYLRNVVRESGVTCMVCAEPVEETFSMCYRCHHDRLRFGGDLADLVVPVAYGIKGAQSGYLMWKYKDENQPVPRHQTLLTMLLLATLSLHERCLEQRVGHPVGAWAVVPSTKGRVGEHPLEMVVRRVRPAYPKVELVARERAGDGRTTERDRFDVVTPAVVGNRHVLVIDDTWTTGSRAQSAALALRHAGAVAVTVLVLARWLKPQDGTRTAQFLRRKWPDSFDPTRCPVN